MSIVTKFANGIKNLAKMLFQKPSNKIGLGVFSVGLIAHCGFSTSSELVSIIVNIALVAGAMVTATTIAGALIDEGDITKISSLKWLSISGALIGLSMLLSIISLPVVQYLAFATLLTGSILASLLFIYTSFISPAVWATEMIKQLEDDTKSPVENNNKEQIEQEEEEKELELTYYFKK